MSEPLPESFAGLLKQLRMSAGLTQEELATAATLSYRSISDLERGINQTARKDTARLLADALNLRGAARSAFEAVALGRASAKEFAPYVASRGPAAAMRTLPRDISSFIGRNSELQQLLGTVDFSDASGKVVDIHAISGMAGVGKTAFALHAAHQLASHFPDGQIFLPLHAHTPGQRPVDPAEALASLLQTAGIAAQQIPPDLEARARMWRDHVADKRMLFLLDDAVGHEQVRPLLPGTAGSLVLVTSRIHLAGLEDAQTISLDILPPDEAAQLLIRLAARSDLEPQDSAVISITHLCGYLPLAIGMIARKLHHHPRWTAEDLAVDMETAHYRLEVMKAENLSVAAAFELSYRDLTDSQKKLFRRLGLHPGTDIDAFAAAALIGSDFVSAQSQLEALYDHYLLIEPIRGRYRLHDLIGEYARKLASTDMSTENETSVRRLLDYYLYTCNIAANYLTRRKLAENSSVLAITPECIPKLLTMEDAVSWMDAERSNLHAAAGYADAHSYFGHANGIPAAMHGFLRSQGYWDQARILHDTALDR